MSSDILSLQQLSFICIKNNFSFYLYCYHSSENEVLKKGMLFLQRVYTQQLFNKLESAEEVAEIYFDFILNKYLREINLALLTKFMGEKEEILEKVIPIAHNLEELSYATSDWQYFSDNALAVSILEKLFPHSINVRKVVVPRICNDELLECIVCSCPGLSELDISSSNVSFKGIEKLFLKSDLLIQTKCPLKRLNLRGLLLKFDEVVFLLKNMPALEEVNYYLIPSVIQTIYLQNKDKNIYQDTVKHSLLSLDFSDYHNNNITDLLEICAETCPKVKSLHATNVDTAEFKLICKFSNLENLNLEGYSLMFFSSPECINDFLILIGKKLKHLALQCFSLSMSVLVESCPNLETLSLSQIDYQNTIKNPVKSLKLLHSFSLDLSLLPFSVNGIWDMKLMHFLPNVENLSFTDCVFDETNSEEFMNFCMGSNLKHLKFEYSITPFHFLQRLIMNCRSLRFLTLNGSLNLSQHEHFLLDDFIKESKRNVGFTFLCED